MYQVDYQYNCSYHYSAHLDPTLLEIYSLAKGQEKPNTTLRLGLAPDNFDTTVQVLQQQDIFFHQAPATRNGA